MELTNAQGEVSLSGLVSLAQRIEDVKSNSLFQFTRKSTISSTVFIDKQLAGESILNDLMLNIMNLYVGLIMTAMDMNRYITSTQRVRDIMSVVSTEAFTERPQDVDTQLRKFFVGMEAITDGVKVPGLDRVDDLHNLNSDMGRPDYPDNVTSASVIDADIKNANLPSGRIIEIKLGGRNGGTMAVHLLLQLLPRFIPVEVAQQFVALNFAPSLKQRWMQRGAGEISFFKDFLLSHDIRAARMRALKADKTGALQEMMDKQKNGLFKMWMKRALVTPEKQNIANTILIFEKRAFDVACNKAGLNFGIFNNRQRFFDKTFAMMLCTVDPMYNKVQMFYHGLPAVSEFTFDQIKRKSKDDSLDLISIMKQYASGMAPKF